MTTGEAVAWGSQESNGERSIRATPAHVVADGTISPLTAIRLMATAVAADLLDAFERVSCRVALERSTADVRATVEQEASSRRISQIRYRRRVVTTEPMLARIASRDLLEHEAVVFGSLGAAGHRSGFVVTAPIGRGR